MHSLNITNNARPSLNGPQQMQSDKLFVTLGGKLVSERTLMWDCVMTTAGCSVPADMLKPHGWHQVQAWLATLPVAEVSEQLVTVSCGP